MGRLIELDVDKLKELLNENKIELTNNIISIVRENYIPKADYETRLKADLKAILIELQLEIEEMSGLCTEIHGDEWNEINTVHSQDVLSLIQQKINALKAESEE